MENDEKDTMILYALYIAAIMRYREAEKLVKSMGERYEDVWDIIIDEDMKTIDEFKEWMKE